MRSFSATGRTLAANITTFGHIYSYFVFSISYFVYEKFITNFKFNFIIIFKNPLILYSFNFITARLLRAALAMTKN
jgi:hypothetical protein